MNTDAIASLSDQLAKVMQEIEMIKNKNKIIHIQDELYQDDTLNKLLSYIEFRSLFGKRKIVFESSETTRVHSGLKYPCYIHTIHMI